MVLHEPLLNVGAGRGTNENEVLAVTTADISRAGIPDVQADVEGGLPFRDGSFRTCILFNVLEHLWRPEAAVAETARVLEIGGSLLVAVPFLYRVHRDPDDFRRFTVDALERLLRDASFSNVVVKPCGSGPVLASLAQVDFLVPRRARKLACTCAWKLDDWISSRSSGFRNEYDYPLGYVAEAVR